MNISPEILLTLLVNFFGLILISSRMSAKIEGRFSRMETHLVHIMGKLGMSVRADEFSNH